jgi:uncharacterized protein (UPF0210 family)
MKIRSLTVFLDPGWPPDASRLQPAGALIEAAGQAFRQAGYEVQTMRLATPPFHTLSREWEDARALAAYARELEAAADREGFSYVSLGPAWPEVPGSYELIPEVIAATRNVFLAGALTDAEGRVSLRATRECARVIHRCAAISADGFANLRFAALANVPPGTPFFPAAYHVTDPMGAPGRPFTAFAIATEAAGLAVEAFTEASGLNEARQRLIGSIEAHAARLEGVSGALAERFGLGFNGIDFSLAPFPQQELSIGAALERLGVPALGQAGSLAAAAIAAEAIDRARFARAGFSGLFMPVLEDAVLAQRAASGVLTVKDLLLYSAVCGTGLDTLPLPGDTPVEALQALLLDLAALSSRLNKPLTARLMPIPGKRAGDPTGFDFAFFANSRVMALEAGPLTGALGGDEAFRLFSRRT